jgi:hypothetical protein
VIRKNICEKGFFITILVVGSYREGSEAERACVYLKMEYEARSKELKANKQIPITSRNSNFSYLKPIFSTTGRQLIKGKKDVTTYTRGIVQLLG